MCDTGGWFWCKQNLPSITYGVFSKQLHKSVIYIGLHVYAACTCVLLHLHLHTHASTHTVSQNYGHPIHWFFSNKTIVGSKTWFWVSKLQNLKCTPIVLLKKRDLIPWVDHVNLSGPNIGRDSSSNYITLSIIMLLLNTWCQFGCCIYLHFGLHWVPSVLGTQP